jgi:hypothetical protein
MRPTSASDERQRGGLMSAKNLQELLDNSGRGRPPP